MVAPVPGEAFIIAQRQQRGIFAFPSMGHANIVFGICDFSKDFLPEYLKSKRKRLHVTRKNINGSQRWVVAFSKKIETGDFAAEIRFRDHAGGYLLDGTVYTLTTIENASEPITRVDRTESGPIEYSTISGMLLPIRFHVRSETLHPMLLNGMSILVGDVELTGWDISVSPQPEDFTFDYDIEDGTPVSFREEPNIQYAWMDERIIKAIDGRLVESIDDAGFDSLDAKKNTTGYRWALILGNVIALVALVFVLWRRGHRG